MIDDALMGIDSKAATKKEEPVNQVDTETHDMSQISMNDQRQ